MEMLDTEQTYVVFGIRIRSAFEFARPLSRATGPPDLSFEVVEDARPPLPDSLELIYESAARNANGGSTASLFSGGDAIVLSVSGADYVVSADTITCWLHDARRKPLVEIDLLGTVLALWMEKRGRPALHGSAVRDRDRALVFLGSSHAGKSSLAATLVRMGYSLVTDDLLALSWDGHRFLAHPGYPELRFWPDQARLFAADLEPFSTVHPRHKKLRLPLDNDAASRFASSPVPLGHLFVVDRLDDNSSPGHAEFEDLEPRDAVLSLLAHSFLPPVMQQPALQKSRLGFFCRLAETVPVSRLSYPDSPERLDCAGREITDYLSDSRRPKCR